ncbi:DUF2306 domain-containing protein [Actinokineospora sp. UTMC 2448]|uniref:DUF2306 domain-containing protein n=1 Tax=Actinokineospora sp. UTMC 2448 TaxID=2268449 RepID=UPI0021642CCF|nr:DUF2306 domain-containing protein [Actinokineospora sp. UTMC 2448]UVS79889.1 hypothetical protein Actkin_03639 [Actinokineospora sp. UTMC 2448]
MTAVAEPRTQPPVRPGRAWWRRPWIIPMGAVIVAFLVYSIPPYLGLDPALSRVPEGSSIYYPALLAHIGFGAVAMVSGFCQVWPWFRKRHRAAHRVLGRVYVFAGVLPSATAGLIVGAMSPFGPVGRVSLVLLASIWFGSTITGYVKARRRSFAEHRVWMIRSYTLTLSTITNRIWGPVASIVLTPHLDTMFGGSEIALLYSVAGITNWLGWVVPLLAVELWLQRKRVRAR